MDSYFARDVQELFHLEKRDAFLKCLRLLLRQSGGLIDLSSVASDTSVSRPTIMSWMNIFQITHTLRIVRPFAKGADGRSLRSPRSMDSIQGLSVLPKLLSLPALYGAMIAGSFGSIWFWIPWNQ
jgi:hypothetical protein